MLIDEVKSPIPSELLNLDGFQVFGVKDIQPFKF